MSAVGSITSSPISTCYQRYIHVDDGTDLIVINVIKLSQKAHVEISSGVKAIQYRSVELGSAR